MADEMLETYIRQLLESHRTPEVTVAWQGGEPTMMGLDFFKTSIELVEKYKRPEQQVEYTIQINGVLFDERWAEFFKENEFLVGLSVDGPRELHDAYRVDKRGAGSFDRVMTGYEHLRSAGVEVNILCTIHAANQSHPLDVYRFFRDEMGIRFIPIVERATETMLPLANLGWSTERQEGRPLYVQAGNRVTDRTVDSEAFGRFLIAVFEEWVRNKDVGEVFVQHFDVALANWHGEPPSLCIFSETCGLALALEHNGDLYSGDHYVEPDHLLGKITDTPMIELIASDKQREFGRAKRETLPQYCLDCEIRFACHGGCPRNRFIVTPDGEKGLNYLCSGYKLFFNHINPVMKQMSQLLAEGRAPSEVPAMVAGQESERYAWVGRNDPCPCGNGKKYKKCHGAG